MLSTQLVRLAVRQGRQSSLHATRAFSATASRAAEVELTIGGHYLFPSVDCADLDLDGKKVSIEGDLS